MSFTVVRNSIDEDDVNIETLGTGFSSREEAEIFMREWFANSDDVPADAELERHYMCDYVYEDEYDDKQFISIVGSN
jgi:hypothetical protein